MSQFAASDIADRAEQVLAPLVEEAGLQLLMCDWKGRGGRPELCVYIETEGEGDVGIDDCVQVHHAITDLLDVEDFVPGPYVLQVSSPGVERPLRRPAHFADHLGKEVRVRTWEPISERRNWKGRIVAVEGDILTVEVDGLDYRIPVPGIERANLVYIPPAKGVKKGGSTRKKRGARR